MIPRAFFGMSSGFFLSFLRFVYFSFGWLDAENDEATVGGKDGPHQARLGCQNFADVHARIVGWRNRRTIAARRAPFSAAGNVAHDNCRHRRPAA